MKLLSFEIIVRLTVCLDIREYAILLIKGLLAENTENQEFVASLEAREAVSSDALHEAGYETSIIDGKVSLRRR